MKKVIYLIWFLWSMQAFRQGSDWTAYEVLYNQDGVKLEVAFRLKANSCEAGARPNRFKYRVTGQSSFIDFYVNWKLDYINCQGQRYTLKSAFNIGTNGNNFGEVQNDDDMFVGKKIKMTPYSDFEITTGYYPENGTELKSTTKDNQTQQVDWRIKYQDVFDFVEERALVKKGNLFGYVDENGVEVIKCKYLDAFDFSDGRASVKGSNGLYGFVDMDGKEVVKCIYKYLFNFSEEKARVQSINYLWGYVDMDGNEVIKCQYKENGVFSEGMAAVKNSKGLWGFINSDGNLIIDFQFKNCDSRGFNSVKTIVQDSENRMFYINTSGECMADCP